MVEMADWIEPSFDWGLNFPERVQRNARNAGMGSDQF